MDLANELGIRGLNKHSSPLTIISHTMFPPIFRHCQNQNIIESMIMNLIYPKGYSYSEAIPNEQ